MRNVLFNGTLNAILNSLFKAEFNTNVKPSLKERFVFLDYKWSKINSFVCKLEARTARTTVSLRWGCCEALP